jgi:mannose-6-phosphate isomerase-like protein (cupin superfamily)
VDIAILDLNDNKNWNKWVIGTEPKVEKSSPFYSEQLQVSYLRKPDIKGLLEREKKHSHDKPIEEFYFLLSGSIELSVGGKVIALKPKEILTVPPEVEHNITKVSEDLELIVFRAPISTDDRKRVTQ